jgi:dihydropteroate synthase
MINDVTAGRRDQITSGGAEAVEDSPMFVAAAELHVPLVLMHMLGEPRTMQSNPTYTNVVAEVRTFLHERVAAARASGVRELYVDPGIGFGKQVEHNLTLLSHLDKFAEIAPVVLGISRKRFLGTLLGIENAEDRDTATMLMHALLLPKNVAVIRVHNVELVRQLKTLHASISANPRVD